VLTGGAVGLAAVAGTALGTAQPASAGTANLTEIMPSGDQTGAADTQNIMTAIEALTNGGVVYLGPGDFYVTFITGYSDHYGNFNAAIVVPAQTSSGIPGGHGVSIQGSGSATVVHVKAGVTGFYCHRTSGYGGQYSLPAQQTTSFLRDFVVDGTLSDVAAIGVDIGDGWGYDLDLTIVNFTFTNSIGLNIINRVFWTEKCRFRAQLMNNAIAAVVDTAADKSHEYNFYDFNIFCNEDQQGVVLDNGTYNSGCTLWLHGNMSDTSSSSGPPTNNVAALTITGTDGSGDNSQLSLSEIVMKVEGNARNPNNPNIYPYGIFFGANSNGIQRCHGIITHSLTHSNLNNGEFSFRGLVSNDSNLSLIYTGGPDSGHTSTTSPPSVPPSGTRQENYGPDQMVYVTGGNVTSIYVNNNNVPTGQTQGGFFIPAGGFITLNYSGQPLPSWTWVPAANTAY
jgi:hypothetical protein